jgi:hypothetical protein
MMKSKTELQKQLILIKNLCADFEVTVERSYDTPNSEELIVLIGYIEEECRAYLRALRP